MSTPQRYCFVQDNDCDWYLLPVELRKRFEEHEDRVQQARQEVYFNVLPPWPEDLDRNEYASYRISEGPETYTFINPIEEG